jgi:sorbitol-specific phosphotransferase system component IIA
MIYICELMNDNVYIIKGVSQEKKKKLLELGGVS